MSKLTYWVAAHKYDAACYNLRARTKREAEALRQEHGLDDYEAPVKVCVEYSHSFDLMTQCLTEGGAFWEPRD